MYSINNIVYNNSSKKTEEKVFIFSNNNTFLKDKMFFLEIFIVLVIMSFKFVIMSRNKLLVWGSEKRDRGKI